jgi:hypothetical protein
MELPKTINDVQYLNRDKQFCIYNKNSHENLLIISACRGANFAYYFSQITNYNIYMIYVVPFMQDETLVLDKLVIDNILKNTKIICCEEIKSVPLFNTVGNNTFFKQWNIDESLIKIHIFPNLELRYLSWTFFHDKGKTHNDLVSYFNYSKEYLFNRMKKYNFCKSLKFIELYFKEIQLFHSLPHPTVILSIVVFIELCQHIGIKTTDENIKQFIKHNFLGGYETPVFQKDIDMYGFKYKYTLQHDSLFENSNLLPLIDHTHLNVLSNADIIINYYNTV